MTTITLNQSVCRRDCVRWLFLAMISLIVMPPFASAVQTSKDAEDQSKIPAGVRIEGKTDPSMAINAPLITAEELLDFRKKQTEYVQTLRAGDLTPRSAELIALGVRARMLAMTLPEEQRASLNSMRRTFQRDLQTYAGVNQINPRLKRKFREMVLTEVLEVAKELMDNHLYVRQAATILVAGLNILEEDRRSQTPAEPFVPALDFLIEVLKDPQQHQSVKINAINGIAHIVSSDQVTIARNDMLQTAELLAQKLKDAQSYWWLQVSLIQALQATQIDVNRAGAPFIVQGLAQAMSDPKRDPRVRIEAAYTLPRVPIPNNVNLALISWQTAKLTQEMASEYNKNPTAAHWVQSFLKLYAAFQPLQKGQEEGLLFLTDQPGMAVHQPIVKAAYEQVVPVVKAVFNAQGGVQLAPNEVAPISDWLKANDPGNVPIYPGGPTTAQIGNN